MRIVYCIAGIFNSGGMERVLTNKANYLSSHGEEVIIITTDQGQKTSFFNLLSGIQCYDLGIDYAENNGKSFLMKVIRFPFKQYRHKKRLDKLLRELKADIVISMFCNEASFLWKISDGSRKILEIHFSRYKRLQYGRKGIWALSDKFRSWRDGKIVGKYDQFVVLTNEDKNYWGDVPKMRVIPNALSFNSSEVSLLNYKKVIAIGRYDYQKGFDDLITSWSMVHRKHPSWALDIIGNGELKALLQQQIDELGLTASVTLKAPTNHIEDEYGQASLLVMSSRYEGLPMVLLEAQSFGLPIVSFTCKCGPRDIVTDGEDGYLVPERDLSVLAEGMLKLIEDEELRKRMGEAARRNSQRFLEPVIMKQWELLFCQLLNVK